MLPKTKEVLDVISLDKFFEENDIRFVGGTALSYHIQHRLSEDLDFACLTLEPEKIKLMMNKYNAEQVDLDITMKECALNDGEDINNSYMKFNLDGVKVEFFTPPFNILDVEVWNNDNYTFYEDTNLKVASLETIIYMKTMAFWNRKKYRDIFDIYYVLEKNYCKTEDFLNKYIQYNITYTIEHLYDKIQTTEQFYEKENDEGINTLVDNPKPYEWYRARIANYIYEVMLQKVYSEN